MGNVHPCINQVEVKPKTVSFSTRGNKARCVIIMIIQYWSSGGELGEGGRERNREIERERERERERQGGRERKANMIAKVLMSTCMSRLHALALAVT